MKIAGVVAEYNPFHTGHAYHLAETRRAVGPEGAVVCVMSGNWVQRGECALTDKHSRAAMALRGGADLVLELPTVWAAASAEGFARGAVGVLAATGMVDGLSFGSEAGALEDLWRTAECLETPEYRKGLRRYLDRGLSFAAARQGAVREVAGDAAERLSTPNNNLAVEYLRAMPGDWEAMTVRRVGADHDGESRGGYAPASALRGWLRAGDAAGAEPYLLEPWSVEMASMAWVERAVLARLRCVTAAELSRCPGGGEGLAERLVGAAGAAGSLEELYTLAKTKRYAHARVRRLALWAFLGLTVADVPERVPYVRVLGLNGRGRELLREIQERAVVPLITKPGHVRSYGGAAERLFETEARCTDLFGLCFEEVRPGGLEWRRGPVVEA